MPKSLPAAGRLIFNYCGASEVPLLCLSFRAWPGIQCFPSGPEALLGRRQSGFPPGQVPPQRGFYPGGRPYGPAAR